MKNQLLLSSKIDVFVVHKKRCGSENVTRRLSSERGEPVIESHRPLMVWQGWAEQLWNVRKHYKNNIEIIPTTVYNTSDLTLIIPNI